MFLGGAVGDAFALQTEGSDPYTIQDMLPLKFPYRGAFKGYAPGDWTDATDTTVLVLRVLRDYREGKTDDPDQRFATVLAAWIRGGYSELGDSAGLTPESIVYRASTLKDFHSNPAAAAATLHGGADSNGGLIRSAACAATDDPIGWALLFGRCTHADATVHFV